MIRRGLGTELFVVFALIFGDMSAYAREEVAGSANLAQGARGKYSQRSPQANQATVPAEGFIVELDSEDIRAEADRERLSFGLTREDDWIVDLKARRFEARRQRVRAAMGRGRILSWKGYRNLPMAHVRLKDYAAVAELLQDENVVAVYPNEKYRTDLAQSLPLIGKTSVGFDGTGATVAVLDTGVDFRLPAFGACAAPGVPGDCRVVYAADFAADDGLRDANGHGTFVAGILSGVAPGARIAALDVFDGTYAWASTIIAAIDWAIANRAAYNIVAINLSLGDTNPNYGECPLSWAATAFANARAAGILPIVAAGNEGYPNALSSPACAPGAVRVGAVYDDYLGSIAWGECADQATAPDLVTCFSNSANFLTLFAPGALIDAAGYRGGGTSAAAPHVSGGVAVLSSAFSDETAQQILDRMIRTGVPVTDANRQNGLPEITKPRLDLAAAIEVVGDTLLLEAGTDTVNEKWRRINFLEEFPADPVVVASIETYNGGDTAGLRLRKLGPAGFEIRVEEEQSRDAETAHNAERVGYLAVEPGAITDSRGHVIGEAGHISRSQLNRQQWHRVTLTNVYADPVVLINMVTYAGGQPAHIRLRNVGASSFEFQIEEWLYLDGGHLEESVDYFVLESGIHELDGLGTAEAGLAQADHRFARVALATRLEDPVILVHSQTRNGGDAVTTRLSEVSATGFLVKLQEEEGRDGAHLYETIGFLAMERN